ncbi:hypothetical protein [Streptomyces sp. Je 1-369]|uniref:hypothetical protein n=1 Tax=Streptomyces sp. Je 1-369 TaxID=2966192 RepID=UPI00228617BB|nr:hypothetical protein [Streptomyces sp. Je 1-369]WAL93958.1 hypothetical protein NOO62_05265 [Streptomyces sp. Je 1-369]
MTNYLRDEDMELYALLGLMVRAAADLELRLQLIAVRLSESSYAHLWVHGAAASAATKLIKDLAKANPNVTDEESADLVPLLSRVGPLLERRHGYVHGAWSVDQSNPAEPSYLAMRYTKGQESPRFDPISKDHLGDLTTKLSDLTSELMGWFARYLRKWQQSDGT